MTELNFKIISRYVNKMFSLKANKLKQNKVIIKKMKSHITDQK